MIQGSNTGANLIRKAQQSTDEEALFERIDELELLCKYGNQEVAAEVGTRMKKRLISVEHDTDNFPDYLLAMIDQALGTT